MVKVKHQEAQRDLEDLVVVELLEDQQDQQVIQEQLTQVAVVEQEIKEQDLVLVVVQEDQV